MIQGEAKNLMAETATQMIEAATIANQNYLEARSEARADEPLRTLDLVSEDIPPLIPAPKKRRGRPPLAKSQNRSPLQLTGAKSSKRIKGMIQGSPKRKVTSDLDVPPREENNATYKKTKAQQKLVLHREDNNSSCSKAAPKGTIIPAIVKKKVDFHNPRDPLP